MSVSPILANCSMLSGQLSEQDDASFIMIKYGANKLAMVNTDCAIQHSLLHLKEIYLDEGHKLPQDILTTVPLESESGNVCLDLLDEGAVPLDFCNRDPLSRVKNYVTNRSTYTLCQVKRTSSGIIKEAVPLIAKPPSELITRLGQVIRAIERAKKRGGAKGMAAGHHKLQMDLKKRRNSVIDNSKSNRSFASVVRNMKNIP